MAADGAKRGAPAIAARRYVANVASAKRAPYVVPTSKTASVWPVTGTGEPGTGIAICAIPPINAVPPRIKSAWVIAVLFGTKAALRVAVEVVVDIEVDIRSTPLLI